MQEVIYIELTKLQTEVLSLEELKKNGLDLPVELSEKKTELLRLIKKWNDKTDKTVIDLKFTSK